MLKFDVITLFPQLFTSHFLELPFKKALKLKKASYNTINLRDFSDPKDKYKSVDDKPYGGGTGMILMLEPLYKAITKAKKKNSKVILLSPRGEKFTQQKARQLINEDHIILVSGRYEGVDERITNYIDETISIGDYILSGGELPALIIMEAVTRLIPGVLEDAQATQIESFSNSSKDLEYPQYTRPENFNGHEVPKVLLSGNHKEIQEWKDKNSIKINEK